MRLLVITQAVDEKDQVLGFMVSWLALLAAEVESVEVICLYQGTFTLPSNVKVWSLGKEEGSNRLKYLVNFYKYLWKRRHNYDVVWIHMNQLYVLLGSWFWRFSGKPISLWYAHGSVSFSLWWAEKLADIIFTSSASGFRLKSRKVQIVGQGVNADHFKSIQVPRQAGLLVHVGRISKIKRQLELVQALNLIKDEAWRLVFYGGPVTAADRDYLGQIKEEVVRLGLEGKVEFGGIKSYHQLPAYLAPADLFVTMSQTGSLDKAVLDAMAAGIIPVIAGETFQPVLGPLASKLLTADTPQAVASKIEELLYSDQTTKNQLRSELQTLIANNYSLTKLLHQIVTSLDYALRLKD